MSHLTWTFFNPIKISAFCRNRYNGLCYRDGIRLFFCFSLLLRIYYTALADALGAVARYWYSSFIIAYFCFDFLYVILIVFRLYVTSLTGRGTALELASIPPTTSTPACAPTWSTGSLSYTTLSTSLELTTHGLISITVSNSWSNFAAN